MKTNAVVIALAAVLLPASAFAQASPDSVQHRNDCRLAEQVVSTGNPRPHALWAHSYILKCGADTWSRAATAALQRLRTSTDEEEIGRAFDSLIQTEDRRVFNVGLQIAGDRAASEPARVHAFVSLLRMIRPDRFIDAQTITRQDRQGRYRPSWCTGGVLAGELQIIRGEPLTAADREQLRQLGRALAGDVQAPARVRAAAFCATVM